MNSERSYHRIRLLSSVSLRSVSPSGCSRCTGRLIRSIPMGSFLPLKPAMHWQ